MSDGHGIEAVNNHSRVNIRCDDIGYSLKVLQLVCSKYHFHTLSGLQCQWIDHHLSKRYHTFTTMIHSICRIDDPATGDQQRAHLRGEVLIGEYAGNRRQRDTRCRSVYLSMTAHYGPEIKSEVAIRSGQSRHT